MRNIPIHRVVLEKLLLLPPRILHWYLGHDILLTPVDDTNKAEFEGIGPAGENVQGICPGVHEVELCENAERTETSGVDSSG